MATRLLINVVPPQVPFLLIPPMRRVLGLALAVATQAFFGVTVVGLFSFLQDGVSATGQPWIVTDTLLALQFAIPHSILLHPRVRQRLRPYVTPEYHGIMFCLVTCVSLMLLFGCWRGTSRTVWDLSGTDSELMSIAFLGSWAALIYSLTLNGAGYQTGWTQWLYWYRGQSLPRRGFSPRGAYHILRHPVYLSFLGLIWFTPHMTLDRALLTVIWTAYIFVGSVLKDRRLKYYLGASYAAYMSRVPGYPLIPVGPLARRPECSG